MSIILTQKGIDTIKEDINKTDAILKDLYFKGHAQLAESSRDDLAGVYTKILNAESVELPTTRLNEVLTINLTNEVIISGAPNKGDSKDNYYDFNIVIELPKDVKYKINDLKELTCDVVYY